LVALQALAGPAVAPHNPLAARAVFELPSIGSVVLADSPSPGLSAIRVFVPLDEGFGEAGAGRVLTQLATERVRGIAARSGARFSATRSGAGIAYAVSGSDLDLDYLFLVMARALSAPADGRVALRRAVQRVRADLEPSVETGKGWTISSLSDRMCPTSPPWVGSLVDLGALDGDRIGMFWSRTHAAGSAVVTVATSLPQAIVLASLDLLGTRLAQPSDAATRESPAPPRRPRAPSVLRRWYGEGRPVPQGYSAAALVVGELLERRLPVEADGYELFAELRETACGPALIVVGSAFRGGERTMRRRVTSFVDDLTTGLDAIDVAEASAALRLRMLWESDAPDGRASAVGSLFEGGPSVSELVDALEAVRLDDVVRLLEALSSRDPLRAEVNP